MMLTIIPQVTPLAHRPEMILLITTGRMTQMCNGKYDASSCPLCRYSIALYTTSRAGIGAVQSAFSHAFALTLRSFCPYPGAYSFPVCWILSIVNWHGLPLGRAEIEALRHASMLHDNRPKTRQDSPWGR